MNMPNQRALSLAVAASLMLALPAGARAQADEDPLGPFSIDLGTGIEYDSNVAVLELDASSGEGDLAALIDVGIGYDKDLSELVGFKAGYDFSQSLHQDFDEFDLQIHRLSGEGSLDFGSVDAGVMLQYVDAGLDGDEFLVLKQASPYISRLFGKRLFLRLAYARTDKDFTTSPGRDATADSLSTDAFIFLDGLKTYLVFGYRYDSEDAVDAQYDYTGGRLKAQLSRRLTGDKRGPTLKLRLGFETRDYEAPAPSISAERQDDRLRLEAMLQVPLSERLSLEAGYEYADNRSNLPSVNFSENVLSLKLGAKL